MNKILFIAFFLGFFLMLSLPGQTWKQYPYQPEKSLLRFPDDEGYHPGEPIEWWYINGHARGAVTGHDYSFMVAYFYQPVLILDGFRILSLCDETAGVFMSQACPCNYPVLDTGRMNLQCNLTEGGIETFTSDTDALGNLIPFEYILETSPSAEALSIRCSARKPPLIVADSGLINQGASGYSYYYSLTDLEVSGLLTFQGISEEITGIAWIDRQYGSFNPYSKEDYEWLSLQLDNHVELNIWNIFTPQRTLPASPAYRICSVVLPDGHSFTTPDFSMERTRFGYTDDGQRCYANQWKIRLDTLDIALTATTLFSNHEIQLPFRFFEGSLSVTGTFDGIPVLGRGFAELIHAYEQPEIRLFSPDTGGIWDSDHILQWEVLNPDEGNLLQFDVEIKNNKELSFNKIIHDCRQNFLSWNPSLFYADSAVSVRITGYSPDSSLNTAISSELKIASMQREFTACSGEPISIPVSLRNPALHYQWLKDGEIMEGETDSTLLLTSLPAPASGAYACIITNPPFADTTLPFLLTVDDHYSLHKDTTLCDGDEFMGRPVISPGPLLITDSLKAVTGCDSIIHYHIGVDPCTRVLHPREDNLVMVIPDPARQCIMLRFSGTFEGKAVVFDGTGQCLGITSLPPGKIHEVPLKRADPGVYFIKISGTFEAVYKWLFL